MRINKICLTNYRQFREHTFEFTRTTDKPDLHILIAVTGTGKSNLLNAIIWCLYNSEPFLSEPSDYPRLNMATIEDTEDGANASIVVEVHAETSEGDILVFKREEWIKMFKKDGKRANCSTIYEKFQVLRHDSDGNAEILEGERAIDMVAMFVPLGIREFFFFDGERLDKYFMGTTGQKIKEDIYQVSRIDLLDKVRDNMNKVLQDFRREAGRGNPRLEEFRVILEYLKQIETNKVNTTECLAQLTIALVKIEEINKALRTVPDVGSLAARREKLLKAMETRTVGYHEQEAEKRNLIFSVGVLIMLREILIAAQQNIDGKKRRKELPPPVDKRLLDKILDEDGVCICGTHVPQGSNGFIVLEGLRDIIQMTSEAAADLLVMDSNLTIMQESIYQFRDKHLSISKVITQFDQDLQGLQSEVDGIDKKLQGHDIEAVSRMHRELTKFEEIRENMRIFQGTLEEQRRSAQKEADEAKDGMEKAMLQMERLKDLRFKVDFTNRVIKVLDDAKEKIVNNIRSQLEAKTTEWFLRLHWKRETYTAVKIAPDYMLIPLHVDGYSSVGGLAEGEREMLALAFSLALHSISGFDSGVVIDRPFAKVSGDPIKGIANAFVETANGRQVILLMTPQDYKADAEAIFRTNAVSTKAMTYMEHEKTVKVEDYV